MDIPPEIAGSPYETDALRARSTITTHFGTPIHPARLRCGKGCIQRVCAPFRALPVGRLDAPKYAFIVERALSRGIPTAASPGSGPLSKQKSAYLSTRGGIADRRSPVAQQNHRPAKASTSKQPLRLEVEALAGL